MTDQDPTEGEFHIVEHPIAGPARQFQVTLDDGTTLGVHSDPVDRIVQLDVVPPDRDAATATVSLSETEAAALAEATDGTPDLAVWSHPVTPSGRVELLPFLHEQAISITNHRFGNPTTISDGVI